MEHVWTNIVLVDYLSLPLLLRFFSEWRKRILVSVYFDRFVSLKNKAWKYVRSRKNSEEDQEEETDSQKQ